MALWKQAWTHIRSGTLPNTHTTHWPRGAHTVRAIFKGWLKNRGRRGTDTGDFSGQRHTAGRDGILSTWQVFGSVKSTGSSTAVSIYITRTANCFKELLSLTPMTVLSNERTKQWKNRREVCELAVQPAYDDFIAHFKHFSGKALSVIGKNPIKGLGNVYLNGFRLKSMNNVNTI